MVEETSFARVDVPGSAFHDTLRSARLLPEAESQGRRNYFPLPIAISFPIPAAFVRRDFAEYTPDRASLPCGLPRQHPGETSAHGRDSFVAVRERCGHGDGDCRHYGHAFAVHCEN